jgi:hypothetical protein
MKIFEIITENVSVSASQKNIVDILTTELPQLYHRLTIMAEKMHYNKGNLAGFKLVSGGQKSAWFHDVYFTRFKAALYNFAKSLPHGLRSDLQGFLGTHDKNFSSIEEQLLDKLLKIANGTKNQKLKDGVLASIHARDRFIKKLGNLESDSGDEDDEVVSRPKARDTEAGKQNAAVEEIINDVLGRIDKKQAGEIRNAISKQGNKLLALRQELNKRNIKV